MRLVILLLPCLFVFHNLFSQGAEYESVPQRSTSLQPYYPEKKLTSKKQRRTDAAKTTVDLQREYYERVETVMKERRKEARLMQKPQYSDPMYFGHKRVPKKHAPKKMRHCKECGIRH